MVVSFKPKSGNFRVIGVDTYANEDWVYGDFETKEEAIALAKSKAAPMLKTYVYNKTGSYVFDSGSY